VKFLGKNHEVRINNFSGTERLGAVHSAKSKQTPGNG